MTEKGDDVLVKGTRVRSDRPRRDGQEGYTGDENEKENEGEGHE
jgi:hypothetical protein